MENPPPPPPHATPAKKPGAYRWIVVFFNKKWPLKTPLDLTKNRAEPHLEFDSKLDQITHQWIIFVGLWSQRSLPRDDRDLFDQPDPHS